MAMNIISFVAEALGDSSYLVVGDGAAAVVDPQRDIRPYLHAAEQHGVSITHVFETHVHNDYISGGPELAELGATIVAPAGSNLEFAHTPVNDGDEVEFGGVRLRAVAAPGHTYEHTAYLAADVSGDVKGVFSGGAVLMAGAGRSDLLGPDHTETLTRMQWETAQRLRELLAPEAEVMPTHGSGSFCSSSGGGGERRGPLAVELQRNPVLASPGYEAFRAIHLAAPAPIPAYYRHMAPINRKGPHIYGAPPVPPLLDPNGLMDLATTGSAIVDVRSRIDYTRGHIPVAVGIEESNSLLAYTGWLLPFNNAMALVSYDGTQAERVTTDLFRIGYEDVRGYLPHEAWVAAGRELASVEVVDVEEAARILESGRMPVLDVRFGYEQDATPLPGALNLPVDQLPEWAADAPSETSLVVCASGQRAVMAASFLKQRGRDVVVLEEGGADDIRNRLRTAATR
jgi:hydroxyacylglutathione hydrolase